MKKFKVLFISSSSRYSLPEKRSVFTKKFKALSEIADISLIASSENGKMLVGESNGAELYLSPRTGFKPLDIKIFGNFVFWKGLDVSKKKGVDVIYCQTPLIDGYLGLILKKFTGAKLVMGVHGDWEENIKYSKPGLSVFLPLINRFAGFCLRRADLVRVISESTEKKALEYVDKEKISSAKFPALSNVDSFLEKKTVEPKENSAVFVGSLTGIKGVDYLLDAVVDIKKKVPKFKLYILGRGPLESTFKELAKELGIEKDVVFVGYQPAETVREYLDRCSLLVLPSLSEGLGRIVLEAMSRERPVVGSSVGGIKESIKDGETGILVPPKDTEAIADAVIKILKDKKLAKSMGKKGRAYVKKNYSIENYVKNYNKVFEEALKR